MIFHSSALKLKPQVSIFFPRTAEVSGAWRALGHQAMAVYPTQGFPIRVPVEASSYSKWQIKTNPRALFSKNVRHVFF